MKKKKRQKINIKQGPQDGFLDHQCHGRNKCVQCALNRQHLNQQQGLSEYSCQWILREGF